MQDGWTALHMASAKGHLEVVRALLHGGACADATDKVSCLHASLQPRGGCPPAGLPQLRRRHDSTATR
jgi:ankyrin repeat protein